VLPIRSSLVEGGITGSGVFNGSDAFVIDDGGNVVGDPAFVALPDGGADGFTDDPATPGVDESADDDYGNLQVRFGSAALDTGNRSLDPSPLVSPPDTLDDIATDLEGNSRVVDSTGDGTTQVDLGAYEYIPQAPTSISLSDDSVPEDSSAGTTVGRLSCTDTGSGETQTFTLLDDAGGRFAIAGDTVQVADGTLLNYQDSASHTIRVECRDSTNLTITTELTITVIDRPERVYLPAVSR
jgi:hypothetical protein